MSYTPCAAPVRVYSPIFQAAEDGFSARYGDALRYSCVDHTMTLYVRGSEHRADPGVGPEAVMHFAVLQVEDGLRVEGTCMQTGEMWSETVSSPEDAVQWILATDLGDGVAVLA